MTTTDLISSFFPYSASQRQLWAGGHEPSVDIAKEGDEYVVKVNVPGYERDSLNVYVDNNNFLTISAAVKRDSDTQDDKAEYLLKERFTCNYSRSFKFNELLDDSKISAKLGNGVLEVRIGLAKDKQEQRIAIK